MPALAITVDGLPVAIVSSIGYNIISVHASGSVVDKNFVDLEVVAGNHSEEGSSTHHIYVSELALLPGQRVKIEMLEKGENSHPGKTIDELFPDKNPARDNIDFTPNAEVFSMLRQKPRLREKYSLRIGSTSGATFVGDTVPGMHGFSLSVLWDAWRPDSTRVSLHSYTLDGLEKQAPMTSYFEERIHAGDSILFEPVA